MEKVSRSEKARTMARNKHSNILFGWKNCAEDKQEGRRRGLPLIAGVVLYFGGLCFEGGLVTTVEARLESIASVKKFLAPLTERLCCHRRGSPRGHVCKEDHSKEDCPVGTCA